MNQKQRDLLCKMIKTEADQTSKELDKQFMLLGSNRFSGFSRYGYH